MADLLEFNGILFSSLPLIDTHEQLFEKYKRENEHLGILDVAKTDLDLYNDYSHAKRFFQKGLDLKIDWQHVDKSKMEYWDTNYMIYVYAFIKLSWLTYEYLKDGTFKNPLMVFWNPRKQKWDIHPGVTRQVVLNLFGPDIVKNCVAFNTSGKEAPFKKIFKNIKELKKYFKSNQIMMFVIADHGSLIPQLHFDVGIIRPNVKSFYSTITNFFNTVKIQANFDLNDVCYSAPKKPKRILKVLLDEISDKNILKAFLILPFEQFHDRIPGVKIETIS